MSNYTHTPVVDLEAATKWYRDLRVSAEYMDSSGMAERILNGKYVEGLIAEVRALRGGLSRPVEQSPTFGTVTISVVDKHLEAARRLEYHLKGWGFSPHVLPSYRMPAPKDYKGVVLHMGGLRGTREEEILVGSIARVLGRYVSAVVETYLCRPGDFEVYICDEA